MKRRTFLITSALAAAGLASGRLAVAATDRPSFNPDPESGWRVFEVTTRVEPNAADGAPQVWLPLPSVEEASMVSDGIG